MVELLFPFFQGMRKEYFMHHNYALMAEQVVPFVKGFLELFEK